MIQNMNVNKDGEGKLNPEITTEHYIFRFDVQASPSQYPLHPRSMPFVLLHCPQPSLPQLTPLNTIDDQKYVRMDVVNAHLKRKVSCPVATNSPVPRCCIWPAQTKVVE